MIRGRACSAIILILPLYLALALALPQQLPFISAVAGIVNPINPLLEPEKISAILRETNAKVVVTLKAFPKTDLPQKVAEAVKFAPNVKTVLEMAEERGSPGLREFVARAARQLQGHQQKLRVLVVHLRHQIGRIGNNVDMHAGFAQHCPAELGAAGISVDDHDAVGFWRLPGDQAVELIDEFGNAYRLGEVCHRARANGFNARDHIAA